MIVTFLRSSSYGAFSFCPMQYYLDYTLGMRPDEKNGWAIPKPQAKADLGSMAHKALELLACKKVATQEGRDSFADEELGKSWDRDSFSVEAAIEESWRYYSTKLHWDWGEAERRQHGEWVRAALSFNGGHFDPSQRNVVWPEKRFDFTIDRPWARYSYELPDGKKLEGQLGIKGTIDLVCLAQGETDVVELVDWKTGQRKDWATGKRKDFKALRKDPQLRLYHYALSRLCPWAREIFITIVFIRDGGPFSLPFYREDLPETEEMLRKRFEEIRDCERPPLVWDKESERWKCKRLCTYFLNKWDGSGESVCSHVGGELQELGMKKTTEKYGGDLSQCLTYGSGGGRSQKEAGQ